MDFHFKYDGQCKITADNYDEAVKQMSQMLRGIYSYHQIHPTCSMLATPSDFGEDYEDEEEYIEDEDGNWVLK